jgi:hypothetical protein
MLWQGLDKLFCTNGHPFHNKRMPKFSQLYEQPGVGQIWHVKNNKHVSGSLQTYGCHEAQGRTNYLQAFIRYFNFF